MKEQKRVSQPSSIILEYDSDHNKNTNVYIKGTSKNSLNNKVALKVPSNHIVTKHDISFISR